MIDENRYNDVVRKGTILLFLIAILAIITMFMIMPVKAATTSNSSVNLTGVTKNSLTYEVTYKGAIRPTGATFDGIEIDGFDLQHNLNYTASDLEPNTTHQFCIYKDLYNCEKGTTLPDTQETDNSFLIITIIAILCIIVAVVYNRIVGFIGLMFGALLTMMSFSLTGFNLLIGIFISIASIISIFWGRGE